MHITAATVIVCMGIVDASMYINYATDQSDDLRVITEEHEMDIALADGEYDGENSDSANWVEDFVITEDGQHLVKILEIVPTKKKAVVGFTIAGCEPFVKPDGTPVKEVRSGGEIIASEVQMREAYMDALINKNPGPDFDNSQNGLPNTIKEMNAKFQEENTGIKPFAFEFDTTYKGYYKYIGGNLGVYSIVDKDTANPKFRSRFYYNSNRNDYIFVYNEESNKPQDVNVTGQKRIRYMNKDKFIRDVMGVSEEGVSAWKDEYALQVKACEPAEVTIEEIEDADIIIVNNGTNMDYYRYALNLNNKIRGLDESTDNNRVFGTQNDFTSFEIARRIYERVVVRQDVAFIASKNCLNGTVFDTNLRKLMAMLFFVKKGDDVEGSGREMFMDFMKIYTSEPGRYSAHDPDNPSKTYWDLRQEDERFIAPSLRNNSEYFMHHLDSNHPGHPFVLNAGEAITGGRFVDGILEPLYDGTKHTIQMRRRTKDMYAAAGIPEKSWSWPRGYDWSTYGYYKADDTDQNQYTGRYDWCMDAYQSMSNTTDYVYIDANGDFVRDGKYSGYWYNMDDDDNNGKRAYKKIAWDAYRVSTWPWNVVDGGCLKDWFFHKDTTVSGRGGSVQGNLHLMFDYFTWGSYKALNGVSGNSNHINQTLVQENALFKSTYIKEAVDNRPVKREITSEERRISTKKDYFISMNILNGDGVNKNLATKNKTLYYNQYELGGDDGIIATEARSGTPKIAFIPIKIRIKSSCRINNIKVLNEAGTVIADYRLNADLGNTVKRIEATNSAGRTLTLERTAGTYNSTTGLPVGTDGNPDVTGMGEPKYTFDGKIYDVTADRYQNKRNAKFKVVLSVEAPGGDPDDATDDKTISDEITFVKRDFFMLD